MLELCFLYVAITKLEFVDTSIYIFFRAKQNCEMFSISIAPKFNLKVVVDLTLNHMDTKSIHNTTTTPSSF
jgi:hypothetical protein